MKAYFVITHGSRSPRSVLGRKLIEAALQARCPQVQVGGGCLEGQSQILKEQMASFAQTLPQNAQIIAIPLFLLKGVHTQIDIPEQIPPDRWQLTPILGDHPSMAELLDSQFPRTGERYILSHGSNYPGATAEFASLARSIAAQPLYWQGEPNWQTCPDRPSVSVLPYFLAESYILEKIRTQAKTLNLLPTPFVPGLVAQMAQELAESLE